MYFSSYSSLVFEGGKFNFDYLAPEVVETYVEEDTASQVNAADEWFSETADDWSTSDWDNSSDWNVRETTETVAVEKNKEPEPYKPIIDLPEITGPVITFENTNLSFITKFDSARLFSTSGSLMLLKKNICW